MTTSSRLVFLCTIMVLVSLAGVMAKDVTVNVKVQYPASQLPSGTTIQLAGSDPLSWKNPIPLTASNAVKDQWETSFVVSGINRTYPTWTVSAKVLADTTFQLGCNERFTLNENHTTLNITFWPYFYTTKGVQETLKNIHSPQLNNTRHVWIYQPPGYVENPYRYEKNVNLMQDGQNLAPLWNVPEHLDKHIIEGTMESLFVIGPYNMDAFRIDEYTYVKDPNYGGGDGDKYLDFLEQTLTPMMAKKYRVHTSQKNLGILGSSLGGLIACYAGVTRPHVYSKIGCMSSSFWWDYENFRKTIVPKLSNVNSKTQQYYIDSGDSGDTDDGAPETSVVTTLFVKNAKTNFVIGQNLFYYLQRGGHHNEYYWSLRFHVPMEWLYFHDAVWNYHEQA